MMAAAANVSGITLGELLDGVAEVSGAAAALPVTSLAIDSRQLETDGVFLACNGFRHHGLEFLAAVEDRAAAILAEPSSQWPPARIAELADELSLPVIIVPDLSRAVGALASRFYGDPSHRMKVLGVTGTNGKTSCTHFLAQALAGRERCALVGTLGNGFPERLATASHTTPDPLRLQAMLADFVDSGASAVAMEVSSHALHQGRITGTAFDVALFTNLSRDHLDYHVTMEAYADAKAALFAAPGLGDAVINGDDAFGRRLLATLPAAVRPTVYGMGGVEHAGLSRWLAAERVELTADGLLLHVEGSMGSGQVQVGVLGRFNAYNLLAVLGALLAMDIPFMEALERLKRVRGVPGRMELFTVPGRPAVVVDYAHTPDALEQALGAVREHCRGRLWCVFGCGGDRDQGKRPLMGQVAERFADRVLLTNDNPRSEDEGGIITQILGGMSRPRKAMVERDRGRAIEAALHEAGPDDWVVIAGKGHEDYQILGDLKVPFSDRERVRRALGGTVQ